MNFGVLNAVKTIFPFPETLKTNEVLLYAMKLMKPDEIDHHGNGVGLDDLYLKKNKISEAIAAHFEYKEQVRVFKAGDGSGMWYEFPFCYNLRS